jgi:hypothetical protein
MGGAGGEESELSDWIILADDRGDPLEEVEDAENVLRRLWPTPGGPIDAGAAPLSADQAARLVRALEARRAEAPADKNAGLIDQVLELARQLRKHPEFALKLVAT